MARDEEMERRLNNWARWKLDSTKSPLGVAQVNYDDFGMPRDPYGAQAAIPTDSDEASRTDAAVMTLPADLRETVVLQYLGAGSQEKKAARLGVTTRSMRDRVERAHRLLSAHFASKLEQSRAERVRVEKLQRSAVG